MSNAEVLETNGDTIIAKDAGKEVMSKAEVAMSRLVDRCDGDEDKLNALHKMLDDMNKEEIEED